MAATPEPGSAAAVPLPASPGRRSLWSHLGTAGVVIASLFSSLVAVAFAATTPDGSLGSLPMAALGFLAAALVAASLIWRRRWPVAICLATSAVAVVMPFDALAPLVALTWVVASADLRRCVWCLGATALAVIASLWRDLSRASVATVFAATSSATGERVTMLPVGYVVLGAVAMAAAIGVGLLRRYRADATSARRAAGERALEAETLRTQTDELRTELSRQDERELIAREMHDTVAHQLSLLSLHASALEVAADDPGTDVAEAARSMRSSAHQALEEMRALIASLRTEGDAFAERHGGPAPRLADLPALIDEAKDAGVDIGATVFVDQAEDAPPALTRAVYRVVQESLTNVMKHAPGARVDVDLRAAPGRGVDLTVRNGLGAGNAAEASGGAGLVGMRERSEALGGTFQAGPVRDAFEVRVHLPWAVGEGPAHPVHG